MPYPNYLYFQEKQEGYIYSTTPVGVLDINRLLEGKPAWKNASHIATPQKKSLIVADWTAKKWSKEKINQVVLILKQLMNEGFILYLWQSNHTIRINNSFIEKLFRFDVREDIELARHDLIKSITAQTYQIPYDHLFVLDDHYLSCLLSKQYDAPRTLNASDLLGQDSHIFLHNQPPLMTFIHDDFSRKINQFVSQNPPVNTHLLRQFNSLELDNSLLEILNSESKITVEGATFEAMQLKQLSRLTLSEIILEDKLWEVIICPELATLKFSNGFISTVGLSYILSHIKQLKKLHFSQTVFDPSDSSCQPASLNNLTSFDCYDSLISMHYLHNLLANSSRLEVLSLTHCSQINDELSYSFNFLCLEEVYCNDSAITVKHLSSIIERTHLLRVLNISGCDALDDDHPLPLLDLSQLEVVNCAACNINATNVRTLLFKSPRLRIINLHGLEQVSEVFITPMTFIRLEEFNANNTEISLKIVHQNLEQSKKLVELRISGYQHTDNESQLGFNFPNLATLDISSSAIEMLTLFHLLYHSRKLRSLDLNNCHKLDKLFDESFNLPQLRALTCKRSTISSDNLKRLINNSSHLEHLECTLTTELDVNLNLEKLTRLVLNKSTVHAKTLYHFLA
ncbi:MAG: hypothetical protein PSV35_10135, partial [bacterium]|nr:hypothetical protein [bacterium]